MEVAFVVETTKVSVICYRWRKALPVLGSLILRQIGAYSCKKLLRSSQLSFRINSSPVSVIFDPNFWIHVQMNV